MNFIPAGVKTTQIVEIGNPAETLLTIASENEVDIIVMGRRGKNPLELFAMGSVSSYVVAHASCPVLVVK